MKKIMGAAVAFVGLSATCVSASAATLDDVMARLDSLQRDNQAIRRDNELMRKELASQRRGGVQAHQLATPISTTRAALPRNVSTAMAATGPASRSYTGPIDRVYNWSGFYIGAHGGYALDNLDASDVSNTVSKFPSTAIATGNTYSRLHTGFGGLQAGYNLQFGNWIVGAEADGSFGQFKTKSTSNGALGGVGTSLSVLDEDRYSIDWLMTVRGRAGFAYDSWMIYGTGGGAIAKATLQSSSTATFFNFPPYPDGSYSSSSTKSEVLTGWTAGGGIEVGVTDTLSFKTEYLYVSLPDMSQSFPGPDAGGGGIVPNNNRTQGVAFHTFRAGVNYHF